MAVTPLCYPMYLHVHDANTHMLGSTERMHGLKACMHDANELTHGSTKHIHSMMLFLMYGAKDFMHGKGFVLRSSIHL